MFCLFCTEYQGLDNPCRKGHKTTNIREVLECKEYKYNGEYNDN